MLKLFFNRKSLLVQVAFWGAAVLTAVFIVKGGWASMTLSQKVLLGLVLAQVAFAKGVCLYPWYPKDAAGPGIRLQFDKALVPVAYLWLASSVFLWLKPLTLLLALFNLLLLPIGVVACVLIRFHGKDPDPSQPNLLSGTGGVGPAPRPAGLGAQFKEPVSP